MHDDTYIGGRSENNINASCMTISGGRTKQLDIFCRITSFTSDFLSFIVVEHIRFFHGAIQFFTDQIPFLSPKQQCQSTECKTEKKNLKKTFLNVKINYIPVFVFHFKPAAFTLQQFVFFTLSTNTCCDMKFSHKKSTN